jgi:DNA-binding MarR family transcriptional regulator
VPDPADLVTAESAAPAAGDTPPAAAGTAAPSPSGDGESGDDQTIPTLRAALLVLSRRMRYRQASDDISSSEAAVLGRLGRGPQTPGQLAKAEHVRPPSMTRTIERLEERGYVRREADPNDGRQVLVFRTPAGDEFAQRSRELRTAWLAGQFDKLDPHDQRAIRDAAEALRRLSDLP